MKTCLPLSLTLMTLMLAACGGGGGDAPAPAPPPVASCTSANPAPANGAAAPRVTMTMSNGAGVNGDIVITLDSGRAPATVANFLAYVDAGFYNGTVIHRHTANFVLQGGGYAAPLTATGAATLKPTNAPITLEDNNGLCNLSLSLSMARTNEPNSATSQFFINLADNANLNGTSTARGYAVFGSITSGAALVTAMRAAACTPAAVAFDGCLPVPNITITSARRTP
jgi:peptidyl-prolyl cis-trans isomerase A (cyclophilin A)